MLDHLTRGGQDLAFAFCEGHSSRGSGQAYLGIECAPMGVKRMPLRQPGREPGLTSAPGWVVFGHQYSHLGAFQGPGGSEHTSMCWYTPQSLQKLSHHEQGSLPHGGQKAQGTAQNSVFWVPRGQWFTVQVCPAVGGYRSRQGPLPPQVSFTSPVCS